VEGQRPVWPLLVVMTDVDAKDPFELSAVQDEEKVETLAPDTADPALDLRVRVRCPYRGSDHCIPSLRKAPSKARLNSLSRVMDQESARCPSSSRFISRLRAC
jgi:hypothetical protein